MANYIPSHSAQSILTDRLLADIYHNFPGLLDAIHSRDDDDYTDDGILLPDPDNYIRRAAPDSETDYQPGAVNVYIGQWQSSQTNSDSQSAVDGGVLKDMLVPCRVGVSVLPTIWDREATDPITGETLDKTERAQRRVDYYVHALKWGLAKWSGISSYGDSKDYAFRKFLLTSDFTGTISLDSINDETDGIRSRGFVDFKCFNRQKFPLN